MTISVMKKGSSLISQGTCEGDGVWEVERGEGGR